MLGQFEKTGRQEAQAQMPLNNFNLHHEKGRRRAHLLCECMAFLRSINAHSDRVARETGRTRSKEVQGLYTLCADLASRIESELRAGRRFDDSRNEIEGCEMELAEDAAPSP